MKGGNQLITTEPNLGEDIGKLAGRQKKRPVQLSWEDITITANPPAGKCGKKGVGEPKEIIRGVSGTVMPGQFLAIIGASGKSTSPCAPHVPLLTLSALQVPARRRCLTTSPGASSLRTSTRAVASA